MFLHGCLKFNAVNIVFDCVNFCIISISWKGVFSMIRYNIRVNYGDANITKKFEFVHKSWNTLSDKEQNEAFDKAIKELNRVYTTYGRFATTTGVLKLFDSFGFELSIK